MTSKTGWINDPWQWADIAMRDLSTEPHKVYPTDNPVRVTVSVYPCPKTIKRSELAETLRRGWEVRVATGTCGVDFLVELVEPEWLHVPPAGRIPMHVVTAVRCPGDDPDRPWTKVVED